ncbi:flavin-containing monooxygenase [Parashewanella tropica]|uniref:flavin-containing monooxygenase n=1 Tax=Parashewanella tropica TaxID=2547970 RepID=UPI00105A6065|nr:NAD(P)/FAD-dependent oxidoreductase [Parashewanella tropica]
MKVFDTIIIGAGQCGLYAAKQLHDKNLNYLVLERNVVGQVWLNRLDGMRLFTSRQFCNLPGLPLPGDPAEFPKVCEIGRYLKIYANQFNLNIRELADVISLVKKSNIFILELSSGEQLHARTVVNATGSNQSVTIPNISKLLSEKVCQLTSQLSSLSIVPNDSNVVVVGDGASGRQIAGGLAQRCQVTLSTGTSRGLLPNRVLGKDLFWWLKNLGILNASNSSFIAKILKNRNPIPCANFNNKELKTLGVDIKPRLLSCSNEIVTFLDGSTKTIDVVIWAVGYQDNTQWLKLPHCSDGNGFIHNQGETPEPGLFIIGRKWFSCRGSELILGVERDVNHVITLLESYMEKWKKIL